MNKFPSQDYITEFENQLHLFLNNTVIKSEKLRSVLKYTLFSGGKRLRPLLVYFTGELININQEILHKLAIAIELTHTYSLIHDDLPAMDNDDFRRGRESCHKKFDEATAILIGDGLQPLSIEILISGLKNLLHPATILNIINELVEASGFNGMISGQSMDLTELKNTQINVEQLTAIHNLKTGKLISACINMVLQAGNPTTDESFSLKQFAKKFGLLFQMQDDYLDAYQINTHGKVRNSDFENQKITFATLYSKTELYDLIHQQQQKTIITLDNFADKAFALRSLLINLCNRM